MSGYSLTSEDFKISLLDSQLGLVRATVFTGSGIVNQQRRGNWKLDTFRAPYIQRAAAHSTAPSLYRVRAGVVEY